MQNLKSGSCYLLKGSPVYLKCVSTMSVYAITMEGGLGRKVSCKAEDLKPAPGHKVTVKIVMG